MVEFSYLVQDPQGLHVRPVTRLAYEAERYDCRIEAFCENRRARIQSLMSMLALGVQQGMTVTFRMEGPDEEKAAQAFGSLLDELLENSQP